MEYGPAASSSEGREGKRVGFSQAPPQKVRLLSAHSRYGQLALTTVLRHLEELAFLGNVGERVIIITVKAPWAAKTVASLPS